MYVLHSSLWKKKKKVNQKLIFTNAGFYTIVDGRVDALIAVNYGVGGCGGREDWIRSWHGWL